MKVFIFILLIQSVVSFRRPLRLFAETRPKNMHIKVSSVVVITLT